MEWAECLQRDWADNTYWCQLFERAGWSLTLHPRKNDVIYWSSVSLPLNKRTKINYKDYWYRKYLDNCIIIRKAQ